jgi:hypothetical protein
LRHFSHGNRAKDFFLKMSTSSTFAAIPIHHAVTIRLTKSNFILWRAQLLPYLQSMKLMGYIDGSLKAPEKKVLSSTDAAATLIPNPAYERWYDQDQQVLSGLLSSMSEEVLRDVTNATTSKEAWDTLKKMFSSATRAQTMQICVDLTTTKKRNLPAATYFIKIKELASKLAAADAPLRDDEVVAYLLAGLGSDYDPFVTSMTTKNEALSLDEVYAHLLSSRQLQHQAEAHLNIRASANVAGRDGSLGRCRGSRRGRGRGCGVHGRGVSGSSRCSPCQIGGKEGHTAIRCWYRMDDSYTDDPPSANMAATSSYQVDPNRIHTQQQRTELRRPMPTPRPC